jgi:hypothetical protein
MGECSVGQQAPAAGAERKNGLKTEKMAFLQSLVGYRVKQRPKPKFHRVNQSKIGWEIRPGYKVVTGGLYLR